MKKFFGVGLSIFLASTLIITGIVLGNQPNDVIRLKATGLSLNLSNGDISNLTDSYKNDVFTSKTTSNNDVDWEYKYAKASAGLIELGKNKVGIPDSTNFYIGNTSPITSISELTVNFSGATTAYLYGSSNSTDYYLVDLLTSNTPSTRIADYLYFRIVNGNQDVTPMTINSITVEYDCSPSDYSDEGIDITSHAILQDSGDVLSLDTITYMDDFRSSQSLKIVSNDQNNDWVISLNHSYTGLEIKKSNLTFYVNAANNTQYDGSHNYIRFLIYPASGTTRNKNKVYFQTGNINNGSGWTKVTVPFTNLTTIGDAETINSLYIRSFYVTTGVNLDQMHLNLGGEELSPDIINTYEANDMISTDIHFGYGTVGASFDYSIVSSNSVRSSHITIDYDWRMWYYNDTGMGEDMDGKTISFDIRYGDFVEGKSTASASYAFNYSGYKYSISITKASTGVTYTPLEDGWVHISIDIDEVRFALSDSEEVSANLGFNVGYARSIYIDNLNITSGDEPIGPAIVLSSPLDGQTIATLPERARNYRNALVASRESVVNDYILDINEVNTTEHSPRVESYYDSKTYDDYSNPTDLRYRVYNHATLSVNIHLATLSNFSDEVVINTTDLRRHTLENLLRNTTYYWKVVTDDGELTSSTFTFTTEDTARFISAGGVHNVRDFGGYMTKSGKRIKQGLVFRGSELNSENYSANGNHYANLDEDNIDLFVNKLGIQVEYDLRSVGELKDNDPNVNSNLGVGVEYINNDWCPAYKYISRDTNNVHLIAPVFRSMLEADTKHVYYHCWGGADRTGTMSFILGGFLGMSFTDLLLEYEFTTFSKNYRSRDEAYKEGQSFPEMIEQLYNNDAGYDHTGNHDIQEICTNILLTAGLTQSELNTLTSILLED